MIPPPGNIRYDSTNHKLLWDEVPDATEYEILFKPILSPNWEIAYNSGNDVECPFDQPLGVYKGKGKTKKIDIWGNYGPEYEIVVS